MALTGSFRGSSRVVGTMDPRDAFARTVGIQIEEMQAMLSRRALLTTGVATAFLVGKPSLARVAMPARRIFLANPHTGDVFHDVYFADGAYIPEAFQGIDRLMRDHNNDEVADIDPAL